ncbi:hypothetical protein, partial [Caballeronia glebae]|uniref:hypothetical protein n=1 Tax=Caballeronia glebae TaxID=1777143 RepID=UPI001F427EE3
SSIMDGSVLSAPGRNDIVGQQGDLPSVEMESRRCSYRKAILRKLRNRSKFDYSILVPTLAAHQG